MKWPVIRKHKKRSSWQANKKSRNRYFTFLPEMTEGNNLPLQLKPGFTLMDRADPNGWLSGVSRTMDTAGTDVGYAIPDVMAVEQQIRRLIRLPRGEALHHQEMRDWRAVLAILLLWDGWEKDDFWPELRMVDFIEPQEDEAPSSFHSALMRAVSKKRAREGVRIFSLYRTMDLVTEVCPLALVSSETIIAPAANMPERLLDRLLPSVVTWYNRDKKRFEDPTEYLSDLDRLRLVMQLRILQEMNADEELGSCLYTGRQNHLVGLLEKFIQDLNDYRFDWRNGLNRSDSLAMEQLYDRIVAVRGLYRDGVHSYVHAVKQHQFPLIMRQLIENPLLLSLGNSSDDLDRMAERLNERHVNDTIHVYYTYNDIPFAREDPIYILEPMNDPREQEALNGISMEASMLRNYSNQWNMEFGKSLMELSDTLSSRVGANRSIAEKVKQWGQKHLDVPLNVNHTISLSYPLEGEPETLRALMHEFLGMETLDTIYDVFSDRLTIISAPLDAPPPTPEEFTAYSRVQNAECENRALYGLLPVSERMATWLMHGISGKEEITATFVPDSLKLTMMTTEEGQKAIKASYAIKRVVTKNNAIVTNCVRFEQVYSCVVETQEDQLVSNAVEWIDWENLTSVTLWPNMLLPADDWKAYWLHVGDCEQFTPWVMKNGTWQAMTPNRYSQSKREWLSIQTDQYPMFVILKHGGVTCGALYSPAVMSEVRADDSAIISVDFGTTAASIALKQGKHVFPLGLDESLHGFLLRGREDISWRLYSEFLPVDAMIETGKNASTNIITSMVQMFSQLTDNNSEPLVNGCIYHNPSERPFDMVELQSLYCNLKWGKEAYRKHYVYLFLKQCMIQAIIVARLHGAPSVTWRFAMPTSLSGDLRSEYVRCVTQLVYEVASLTGVQLTDEQAPVLFLSENQADGAFFMHEDMVDVRNGYINIDVGGNSTDISLWLNAEHVPSFEQSMEFGCHRILFESIEQWPERLRQDFSGLQEGFRIELDNLLDNIALSNDKPIKREIAMFLFDRWIARWSRNAASQPSAYLNALVILSISFLYYLCGVMLQEVAAQDEIKAKLPHDLQVCFAGNGGRLCQLLSHEQMRKARDFAWLCFDCDAHAMSLIPVNSTQPKQEVALGLLYSELGQTAEEVVMQKDASLKTAVGNSSTVGELFVAYFVKFAKDFPNEAALLMPNVWEDNMNSLNGEARAYVQMVVNNQFSDEDGCTLANYVHCFMSIKKAWGV